MSAQSSSYRRLLPAFALAVSTLAGCVSHQHTIGLGATGTGQQTARQFFFLFGLFQVNEIDTQRMAPDLTSYSIETRFGVVDMLLAPLLAPLTMTTRTVTVRT
ncbi:MAG: hypothetical protein MUC36_02910 [Planctomycetes bacterium]|nr:hypothetical protein [Planctomycetota bacterium]